ncbi:YgjV family protein [Nocardioides sp. GY 10113]|uniref:YgjV family protein n=1 Tax=Nocardioides sp. GY 10113 TaxID=2569761 RepID=UPI0010A875B6|nr:YgjV family protein [Nocardioides sp. GY 10113]TIC79758.1 YgjV family protein [Nocardioides sp. GY 10113]TIC84914.1 YgjV family protein [Nocardioides sp. GY 10113]
MTWLGEHWLSLFGWLGSALLIVSLLQTRVLRFRLLNLSASVILVIFNALVAVWPMVGMNLATSAINIFFITRMLRGRHSEAAYQVLEVGAGDAYLRHFLGVHEADIARHQPGFSAGGLGEGDLAFQVQTGDETVGVVLIRREGEVAQVLLDYVTPRFRDFTPGEFVWRQAPRLRDRGFRKVVTPPGMLAPYYHHLPQDWRPVGPAYELGL